MTENNLALWERLGKTDPSQTKGFSRAGGFKGTAVKPIYTEQKMTEVFGPAGKGWGMGEPSFQTQPGHNGEVLVYCTVSLWWVDPLDTDGTVNTVFGVGGDKAVTYIKPNEQYNRPERWENDDEAFKKAFTDAVGNAMKHLGMSADVHMGRFDDSKYVNELRAELAGEPETPATPEPPKTLVKDQREIWAAMRDEIDACGTVDELGMLWRSPAFQNDFHKLKTDWADQITAHKDARKVDLSGNPAPRTLTPPNFEGMPA